MQNFRFKKEERLCSEKFLDLLFKNGSSFLLYPFRITWLAYPHGGPFWAQVLIGIPKKRFKRSVDRHLLKRRVSEAYRLNKSSLLYPFLEEQQLNVLLAINYVGKEIHDYEYIALKLEKALANLEKQFETI